MHLDFGKVFHVQNYPYDFTQYHILKTGGYFGHGGDSDLDLKK